MWPRHARVLQPPAHASRRCTDPANVPVFQLKRIVAQGLWIVALSVPAQAQGIQDGSEAETARLRLGPVRLTPTFEISNFGVDTNVFNTVENPKRDFVIGLAPQTNYWIGQNRVRISGDSRLEYLYFKSFANQRSLNTDNSARIEVQLARVTPFVSGRFLNTRVRPGFEIDARARRRETTTTAGVDVALFGKTTLTLSGSRRDMDFKIGETFLDVDLGRALDRRTESVSLAIRYRLTPLTTVVLLGDSQRDRFDELWRDADGFRIISGFEFSPFALISGTAHLGFRRFRTLDEAVPDFTGVVADLDVGYALRATRVALRLQRDVTYSFEISEPYYLLTNWNVSLTQEVSSTWDVVGRVGRQHLDYRVALVTGERRDIVSSFGGGVGYRLGRTARFGVNVDHVARRSEAVRQRSYEGLRAGASISIGGTP